MDLVTVSIAFGAGFVFGIVVGIFVRPGKPGDRGRGTDEEGARGSAGEGKRNIYIGNLPYDATEDEVKELFTPYGTVACVAIITERGRSKGFGFVGMPDESEADAAINSLNGKDFKGRTIKVSKAHDRSDGRRGGRGRRR